MNQATTRVLVSDAHPLFRQGIQSLLSSTQDMIVVGEAADGNETIIKVETSQPDVVLLDVDIPGIRSFDGLLRSPRIAGRQSVIAYSF